MSIIKMRELGASAWAMAFVIEAIKRKNMLIDRPVVKPTRRK
jgi:hypothetical protein